MKKFLYEYKKASRNMCGPKKPDGSSLVPGFVNGDRNLETPEMAGVIKWLADRITVPQHETDPLPQERRTQSLDGCAPGQNGTIRTEKYLRDLQEFRARRSPVGPPGEQYKRDLQEFRERRSNNHAEFPTRGSVTPAKVKKYKKKPVSCTDCATTTKDHDSSFYEVKSVTRHKKRQREKTASPGQGSGVGNIQFLFQNQVFMPGEVFTTPYYTGTPHFKHHPCKSYGSPEFVDLKSEEPILSPHYNREFTYDSKRLFDSHDWDADEEVQKEGSGSSSDSRVGEEERLSEVMSELRHLDQWADEQLLDNARPGDIKSHDVSIRGVPLASQSDVDVTGGVGKTWGFGTWRSAPVRLKKLHGVRMDAVEKKTCAEFEVLRKCRHPNLILLMGAYQDANGDLTLICEDYVASLYDMLHVQGRILPAQTAVRYALDVTNALVFLRAHGYIHTAVTSHVIVVDSRDAAKLADMAGCDVRPRAKGVEAKVYDMYSPEPQYVNIENTGESEPLLSQRSSEAYLAAHAVAHEYARYRNSEHYRWQAPELFAADEGGVVHPCEKSLVYSVCLVLWESCNAAVPFESLTYDELRELYTVSKSGMRLPPNGVYPGCLLALLQRGLECAREERMDLVELQGALLAGKRQLAGMDFVVIPTLLARMSGACTASSTDSDQDSREYEPPHTTPVTRAVVSIKDVCTPELASRIDHGSATTSEGDTLTHVQQPGLTNVIPRQGSFTGSRVPPKSVPRPVGRTQKAAYNFEITSYSLPSTPIARSSKIRKNAWLSGELESLQEQGTTGENDTKVLSHPDAPSPAPSPANNDCVNETVRKIIYSPASNWGDSAKTVINNSSKRSSSFRKRKSMGKVDVKPIVAFFENLASEVVSTKEYKPSSQPDASASCSRLVKPASHGVDVAPQRSQASRQNSGLTMFTLLTETRWELTSQPHSMDRTLNTTCEEENGEDTSSKDTDQMYSCKTVEDSPSLKRWQRSETLQDARGSAEDLYIDDDIFQIQEQFGGQLEMLSLGSNHQLFCDKDEECCIIKVKKENDCEVCFVRSDLFNSVLERNAVDNRPSDRMLGILEELLNQECPDHKTRRRTPAKPSDGLQKGTSPDETRRNGVSPSQPASREVTVDLYTLCCQESSSEECLRCNTDSDNFEELEQIIENEYASAFFAGDQDVGVGCLEKISEESLSVAGDEFRGDPQ